MIKVGFTGTRHGMSEAQKASFLSLIQKLNIEEFHHGDCIGSDEQAHSIIDKFRNETTSNIKIHIHPPKYKKYQASCKGDVEYMSDDYLERNHNIVKHADAVIATPNCPEKLRSGTWSTVRYARELKKDIYIIHKSGRIDFSSFKK